MNNQHTQSQTDRTIHALSKALLDDLLDPSISSHDLCNLHNLTLPALATILESESFAIARSCIERINAARASILLPESQTLAIARLTDQLKDRPQSPSHAESQRKSASKLLSLPLSLPSPHPTPKPSENPPPNSCPSPFPCLPRPAGKAREA